MGTNHIGFKASKKLARTSGVCRFVVCIVALASVVQSPAFIRRAEAANGTWLNSGATSATWSETSNWSGGTVPGATAGTTNADTATFNSALGTYGTTASPILIDSGRNISSMLFTGSSGGYTIGTTSGNTLVLTAGGSIQRDALATGSNVITINAPLRLQGGYQFYNNNGDSGGFRIGGAIAGTGTAGTVQTLTLNGWSAASNNNVISGAITDGTAGGSVAISLYGPSTWTLSGTSTITSRVIVNSAGANGTLRNTGNLTAGGNTYDTTFRLAYGTFDNQGLLTMTGPIVLDLNASLLTNSGTIGQSGGNRPIFLNEGSSATNSGVINLDSIAVGDWGTDGGAANTASFTNNAGGSITVTNLNVGKYKYGTFNNSGGSATVSSGLIIGRGDNGRTAASGTNTFTLGSGTVTVNAGATFRLGSYNTATNSVGILNLNGGVLATAVGITGPSGSANTGTFNFNGGTLRGTVNGVTLLGTDLTAVSVKSGGGTVDIGLNVTNTIAANLLDGSGGGGLTKTGSGALVLTGSGNTYTGTTTVTQGRIQIGDNAALPGSLAGNVLLQTGSLTGIVFSATANQTYAGVISGTGRLEKYGNGSTLTLSGNGSVINQGIDIYNSSTVRNTGSATVGTTQILNNGGAFNNQGTFTLSGNLVNAGYVTSALIANSGTINETGGSRTIFLNETGTFANTGTVNVTSIQAGDWGLDGGGAGTALVTNGTGGNMTITNMYVGAWKFATFNNTGGNLTVGSILNIGKSSDARTSGSSGTDTLTLSSGTVAVNAGATFRLGGWGSATNTVGVINLDGGALATAVGITGPSGSGNTGTFNFNGGTLRGTGAGVTLLGTDLTAVSVKSGGGTVDIGSGLTNTIAANLLDGSGGGGLTKTGSGTLVLTGSGNTYTGTTTVTQGKVQIGDAAALPGSLAGNVLLQGSNSIIFSATANQTYAGVISGTGKLEKFGSGSTLTLSGNGSVINQGIDINSTSTLRNTGSATVGTTTILSNGGAFNNQGTFTLSGNLQNASWIPSATFTNSGTINQVGTSGIIFLQGTASLANTGAITVNRLSIGDWGADGGAADTATASNGAGGNMTLAELYVGGWKYGTFSNNGGSVTVASILKIGKGANDRTAASGTNTFNLASGTVTVNAGASFQLGVTGTATNTAGIFNLDGGLLTTAVGITGLTGSGTGNTATFNFNGGTLRGTGSNVTLLGTNLTAVNVKSGGGIVDVGSGLTNTIAANLLDGGGGGGLTKIGAGTLTLSGSNGYAGATTISAGVVSFGAANALLGTSGVSISDGAGLTYTGGATTFGKNLTISSGTGTVRNSGAGTLALSGTLTKNGTILRLTGGSFNVTGQIVGTSANSDLLVDGTSTVTLSTANTYNGPTFVNQASNLILGINNAIPSGSVVTLGNASTTGTLTAGSYTNALGGLAFGSAGGTLKMTASATGAAQLTASTGTMTLTNGTLDLAGSGTSAGLYRLLSAQSIGGSFASVTGSNAAYKLVSTSTSVDYQQRAVLGAVTVTNPASAIITGGSAAFTFAVANSALSGGETLSFTAAGLSSVSGSASGSAAGGGSSGSLSGLVFTGTSVGASQNGTFTVSAPSAYGSTSSTGTVSLTVLDHATSSLSGANVLTSTILDLGTWDYNLNTWTSGSNSAAFTIYNLASAFGTSLTADLSLLSVSGTGNGFSTNLGSYADIAGGSSGQYFVTVNPSNFLTSGTQSWLFTIGMSDKTGMSGATSTNTLTVTANVVVVPEPGALALAGLGIAAAAWAFRRRRS